MCLSFQSSQPISSGDLLQRSCSDTLGRLNLSLHFYQCDFVFIFIIVCFTQRESESELEYGKAGLNWNLFYLEFY